MHVRFGPWRRLSIEELMISNSVVLEKTLESPLNSKEIKPVNLKGNQAWILIGRTDTEAETPVFWLSDVNSWLIGKVTDAGKNWGQKEKRASEDEMAGWHHWCNGHELGQTLGDGEREAWCAAVYGVTKSWTWLGDWTTKTCVPNLALTYFRSQFWAFWWLQISWLLNSILS